MDIKRYDKLSTVKASYRQLKISPHIPEPSDRDYKNGYIVRYFIQKANDTGAKIYEVDSNGYKKFSGNPFYTAVNLDWRLIGNAGDIRESNIKSIKLSSSTLPQIQRHLLNPIQFMKNDLVVSN
jgi:hypothetical protein